MNTIGVKCQETLCIHLLTAARVPCPIRFIRLLRLLHPLFKNGEGMILTQRIGMFFHSIRAFAIHNCEADNIGRENNREISLTKYTEKKAYLSERLPGNKSFN